MCYWIFPCGIIMHPLILIDTYQIFTETVNISTVSKWGVSAVVTEEYVKKWVTSASTDFYECSMQFLVHHWPKCIANGSGCLGEIMFSMWKLTLSNDVIQLPISVVVSVRLYFHCFPHWYTYKYYFLNTPLYICIYTGVFRQ